MRALRHRPTGFVAALTLCAAVASGPAHAAWPHSPFLNVPVCTANDGQTTPAIVSDQHGGAIVAWADARDSIASARNIWARRILASGAPDPDWPSNGLALCTAAHDQMAVGLVTDGVDPGGSGAGAILVWQDSRNGSDWNIYAHRVTAAGSEAPGWPADGLALCTAANNQYGPMAIPDGSGGAIVTWFDYRSGNADIYAQRVRGSGTLDPRWLVNGLALCTAANNQMLPVIVSDGGSGAIVAWQDSRGGNQDIYAQHVLGDGYADPAWPANGRALCTAANNQGSPAIATDGAGGAFVAWMDFRDGATSNIYVQHVLAGGMVDPAWPADGLGIVPAPTHPQAIPALVPDGAAGVILIWYEVISAASSFIWAQHVLPGGDPAWPSPGLYVWGTGYAPTYPTLVSDGDGGAIVAWQTGSSSSAESDVFAQHVQADGTLDAAWPAEGRVVSSASNRQALPALVSDGAGGAILAWQDLRNANNDVYAQRVARFGYLGTPEAEIVAVEDLPDDEGGKVKLSWNASYLDLDGDPNLSAYDVLRSVPAGSVAERLQRGALDAAVEGRPLWKVADGLFATRERAQTFYWEYLASVNAIHYVSGYSYLASTVQDSSAAGNPWTAFLVVGHDATGSMYWPSRPDSGYSVDNLPPATPAPFIGQYAAGVASLQWGACTAPDFQEYRLYRGHTPGFAPGPASLLTVLNNLTYVDVAGQPWFYKLCAVDVHGNSSPYAFLQPAGTVDVPGASAPRDLALARPSPNPARGAATIRFALPRACGVSLAVFDPGGRRVRTLVEGTMDAGEHEARFDLTGDDGRALPAGLWFVRLEAEGRALTTRFATLR